MEASALRRETERRQWLSRLRGKLRATTTLIMSAGAPSTSTSVVAPMTSKSALMSNSKSVEVGEPVRQVKCPLRPTNSQCAENMATYYQVRFVSVLAVGGVDWGLLCGCNRT